MKKQQGFNFLGPEQGFEDFDFNPEAPQKSHKINQASQTFFRIKNFATPSMKSAVHLRTSTMNSNREGKLNEGKTDTKNDFFGKNGRIIVVLDKIKILL